ncbi:NAD-dependent DNA ligase LigA [Mycoplasmopsis columbinasalis]|uniref:DNA ligase n=1 Tax=Mycoplasmopsis columbinasalis TaxID=114880 RepID=A0A449B9L2_9BACT|nr:NAD-dependent DNA ligase LigA [Mycoplasmopsis columbinasalis]VEU77856.1 DNA ligase (NAD(+)) [Mycoplasmopsis columbinasalis]
MSNQAQNLTIKAQMSELITKLNQWNKEYYLDNNPSVSDLIYDQTLLKLEQLEAEYPELISPLSPTQRVGGYVDTKFQKVAHQTPMLSLNKAYNFEEITKFVENIEKILPLESIMFNIEPKIDGLSIALHYKNGYLVQALTRGDGQEGEDVTHNVRTIATIPQLIDYTQDIEIRGEIYLNKNQFATINAELTAKGEKEFANPRNAASGTLRQINPEVVRHRKLDAFLYEIVDAPKHNLTSQHKVIEFLVQLGLPTNPMNKLVEVEDLADEIEAFAEVKNTLPYDADGLVIKLNDLTSWSKLGSTAKFPKHSIAFKYEVEVATSTILDIKPTVGRTGKITYVAALVPVELNQTMVQAATLHNYNFIKSLNIDIGDQVKIIKAGEIIPKIIGQVVPKNHTNYPKALVCPSCGETLVELDDNVDQFCVNEACSEVIINQIYHFASRKSMNIVGLGLSTVKDFYREKLLTNISDIFELKQKTQQLLALPLFKDKKVNNLLTNIDTVCKTTAFYRVLYAIGIKNVGERAAKIVSNYYKNFTEILADPNLSKLTNIPNIGPKILDSLQKYFKNEKNYPLLTKLEQNIKYEAPSTALASTKLANLVFVITGKLSQPRDHFVALIEQNGGKVASSVSAKTSYVLAGEDAGSKLDKAQALKVEVLSEAAFTELLSKE